MEFYSKNLGDILTAMVDAGKEMLKVYATDFEVYNKDDNSPVTLADHKSNEIVVEALSRIGVVPILSEECDDVAFQERKEWETLWLLDPLDGTKEFIKKNGEFCICLALIHQNKAVEGIIYIPTDDEVFFTLEGKSYLVNNLSNTIGEWEKAKQELPLDLEDYNNVYISRSHPDKNTQDFVKHYLPNKKPNYIIKGSAIKFCEIARNGKGLYPRFAPTMEWDSAAGHAIVKNVGYNVYNNDTHEELLYNRKDLVNPWFIVKK